MTFVRFVKLSDLDHTFTKIIKIMSILKSEWSDSLVVSSQFDIDNIYLDRYLGGKVFSDCLMYALFSSQDCLYILCHLMIIFTFFHLNIHYSLGLINSFLARGDFGCLSVH